ncbi:hypothetical protein ABT095_35375 [Kitasatospora sp. NPDC002227]|uniref:hypothetical protein n=1 Tax=Kitasatospora sp. NPDC002227 TaxID=3154773 RepID=UPI00332E2465
MGSHYFISADRTSGAAWPFTAAQLGEALLRRWPQSTVTDAGDDNLDLDVRVEQNRCELTYQADHQVFVFRDQDPLDPPLAIVHTLLRDLAPTVPALWWADYDATPEPFDVTAELAEVIQDFGA